MNVLETEESNAVQALICLGLCKLMLFGLVTDEKVLWLSDDLKTIDSMTPAGTHKSSASLRFSFHGRQSRTASVPSIFSASVQLFVSDPTR